MFKCEPDKHYNISAVITPGTVLPLTGPTDFIEITDSNIHYRKPESKFHTNAKNYYFITQNDDLYSDGQMLHILDVPHTGITQEKDLSNITVEVKILLPNRFGESDLLELESNKKVLKNRKFVENTVYFFDRGKYKITSFHAMDIFSSPNVSYIGLFQKNGIPETIFLPFFDQEFSYSIQLHSKNIHFYNILFDAKSMEMYNNKNNLNLGQNFISISAETDPSLPPDFANGLLLKDCVIANVGNHSGSLLYGERKNIALSVKASAGQLNFEQLRIINCKTKAEHGIIEADSSMNLFFKNLEIDMSGVYTGSLGLTYAVKFKQSDSLTSAIKKTPTDGVSAVFADTLKISPTKLPFTGGIAIEDYALQKFYVPETFSLVHYKNTNGDEKAPAAFVLDTPTRPKKNYSLYDLIDDSFIVSQDPSADIMLQFQQLNHTINTINEIRSVPAASDIKIKLEALDCRINEFHVPSFFIGNTFPKLHIAAVNDLHHTVYSESLIPVAANAVIHLPEDNETFLYYFDFHTHAHYTMQEAIHGITCKKPPFEDPYDNTNIPDYPDYKSYGMNKDASVKNSCSASFKSCCFTALLKEIEIEDNTGMLNLAVGQTVTLYAVPTISNNSFTMQGISFDIDNTADDETIHWFLDKDCDILELSFADNTASITALKSGITILIAKAIDRYNKGEIEKPYASVTVVIREP